jgi:hypothetical protein
MGRASSAKKVARAARAGGRGARGGQRRSLLFPATVSIVCVLGVLLIGYARTQDEAEAVSPGLTDHWHAAYGVRICGEWVDPFQNLGDPNGIHTHGDGAIHIHPGAAEQVAKAGDDATLGVFFEAIGGELTDDSITLQDGTTYTEGEDQCGGEDAELRVGYWANATEAADTDPQIFEDDLADISFQNDREAYTIIFGPSDADIPPPTTINQLDELAGIDSGALNPTTTLPGGSTLSVPGGATTTVPEGETTATTSAPTTTASPSG